MGKRTLLGDEDGVIPPIEQENDTMDREENEEYSEDERHTQIPLRTLESSEEDSDDAPEEVSTSGLKSRTMALYEVQKRAAVESKRRKRKQRTTKVDNELDADTLQLLAENSYLGVIRFVMSRNALSAESTADNVVPESKRIQLTTKSKNLTESIEKEVKGFKVVSLAKDTRVRVGKEINPSILEFQRSHFYGKGTKRVDSGSFMKHKLGVQSHKK
ncbi:hypothetical protein WA171_002085 [Blastocystis sp. BT1]